MKLIIDANIIFAALIKQGTTGELIFSDKLQLFAPEFLFEEFLKYEDYIIKKTHRSKDEFNQFLNILKEQITIVSKEIIKPFLKQADKFSPDPKDTIYLALALSLKASIWSNDRKLKENQNIVKIIITEELIRSLDFLKEKE